MTGQIAQLVVPADGGGNPGFVFPDWARGRLYFVSNTTLRSYQVLLETQTPLVSSQAFNSPILGADIDPVSGALLINRPNNGTTTANYDPLFKFDPNTFAVIGTFGAQGASVAWPTGFGSGQSVVCVACGTQASGGAVQVGYAVLNEAGFTGIVGVVRTDTMQQAGFHAAVISGGSNNSSIACRGASGAAGASVFLSWGASNAAAATLPLYVVTITPGAETYNSASWPTTNPHIQSHTVGTIAAASVDATWTHLSAVSLGYDATDGNVMLEVITSDAVAHQRYLIKVNANTAAVMWATALPSSAMLIALGMPGFSVAENVVGLIGGAEFALVASNTGALAPNTLLGGLGFGTTSFTTNGGQQAVQALASDTAALYFVSLQLFNGVAPNAPVPVAGTPSSFAGYALIGGLIPPPPSGGGGPGGGGGGLRLAMDNVNVTSQTTLLPKNLVSLRWSDDRGHSFGSWVSQPIGEAGEYRTSLQWQRLAYARDRVFELSWSVPMRTALQGCWIDVTPAQS